MSTKHVSGFRLAAKSRPSVPSETFLSVCVDSCLLLGLATHEDLAKFFPAFILSEMCDSDEFLLAVLTHTTPLEVTREMLLKDRELYKLLVRIALEETKRLEPVEVMRLIPTEILARNADPDRLWGFVLRTRFWENRERDEKYLLSITFLEHVFEAMLDSQVYTREEIAGSLEIRASDRAHFTAEELISNHSMDQLYLEVLVPLANKYGWDMERFLQEEITTNPDLRIKAG